MLETTQEQNGNLQNGHTLTAKFRENDSVGETIERYVPEPVTGRTNKTTLTAASRSSLEQQTGRSTSSALPASSGSATEPANGQVGRNASQTQTESLHYFSYLGRLNPQRLSKGCVSAHNVLTSRQVILTSTSIATTNVTDALQQQIDEGQEAREHHVTPVDSKELLECCTCVCCVKAMFYHCTKDKDEEGRMAEHPCSCQGTWTECIPRWGILGILSIFMPCLWCYLPCRACQKVPGCYRDWLAERRLRAEQGRQARQARQMETSVTGSLSSDYVETYEPVYLQRQEALRIQDPYGFLTRGRYVDVGTLNSM